jgi:predicted ABC-type ATPase
MRNLDNGIRHRYAAAGLSPFAPDREALQAMRLMTERIRKCAERREDFAVESTLAGRSYIKMIREWKSVGYIVKIIFLRLQSPEMAVARVKHRVRMGGHDVPEAVIRRRYEQGWTNFRQVYRESADIWQVYDAMRMPPVMVEEGGVR